VSNPAKSEIRRHYFLDRYVIIAPKRNLRPDSFAKQKVEHKREDPNSPALEKEPALYQIKDDQGHWRVKVIANAFAALTPNNPQAYGHQEIVIETPEHNVEFSELSLKQILRIFTAYQERIKHHRNQKGIRYVSVFKNDGPTAGASIAHAHSQIMALPLVPPKLQQETLAAEKYRDQYGHCAYCDVIKWELSQKQRIIARDDHAVALTPYASSSPFGAWILPRRHIDSFTNLNQSELHSIATVLKRITQKLDGLQIGFNFFLVEPITEHQHHFLIKIEPRPNIWAGLELGTGIIINSVPPEYAAGWYRDN
jgi:UDPglucose--hexose-1-phosphate uridylyltransferase